MAGQTTVGDSADIAFRGGLVDIAKAEELDSFIAASSITPGLLLAFSGSGGKLAEVIPAPDAADVDAIIASGFASSASTQVFSGASLNGTAIGQGEMFPPRNVTITCSNHADWDATDMTVVGLLYGQIVVDKISISNGGNGTFGTKAHFSRVLSFTQPAQSGTGGTATVGFGSDVGPISLARVPGVAVRRGFRESSDAFAANEELAATRSQKVYVLVEDAVTAGAQAHVRLTATGDEVRGGFRGSPDGTLGAPDCVPLLGATFAESASSGALVPLRFAA